MPARPMATNTTITAAPSQGLAVGSADVVAPNMGTMTIPSADTVGRVSPGRFSRDTAVTVLGDGRYGGRIDRGWWIERGPNGGYVAAVVLRAMTTEIDDDARLPRTLTVHYLRPPGEGPVEVEVTVERAGRRLTAVSARLHQDGRLLALALGAFGPTQPGPAFADATMPAVPPPEDCPPLPPPTFVLPLRDRYE